MWEFLDRENERESFICWPNNKIIDFCFFFNEKLSASVRAHSRPSPVVTHPDSGGGLERARGQRVGPAVDDSDHMREQWTPQRA